MLDRNESLYSAIQDLANSVGDLGPRAKAAIFGACAQALSPLLKEVERRSGGSRAFPDFDIAIEAIAAFATGAIEGSDRGDLRARLLAAVPHGDDLAAPWSTYAQDAIICADAGLAAASTDASIKSIWIQYALEPHMASMQMRDVDTIRSHGDEYWARVVMDDPAMTAAVAFLRRSIADVAGDESVGEENYQRMVADAAVLRPADL